MLAQNASRFIVKRRQKGSSMEALANILGRKEEGWKEERRKKDIQKNKRQKISLMKEGIR